MATTPKKIVIVGGGFGGVYTARYLEKLLPATEARISLINRENYFVFQPLLPEVLSGSIGIVDTVSPIRRLLGRTELYVREIEEIDTRKGVVRLAPGVRPTSLELAFDYLVIAGGNVTNLASLPGLAEHAFPFKTLGDALRLRNHVLQVVEEAATEPDPEYRRQMLTFVVAGGGFSGVEVVAELNDFLRRAVHSFRSIDPKEIRCVLIHSRKRILPEITPGLADYAQRLLLKRGVELVLNARLASATAERVVLSDGEAIPTRTVVATVPSSLSPLLRHIACDFVKGRLSVNTQLELQGLPEGLNGRAWALGDCAYITMSDGEVAPPTAQHATREAKTVADNITAAIRGQAGREFQFAGLGKLGSLGHHSAVAEVFGLKISGFLAWFLWRTIYLMKLPGLDRKLRVATDWTTSLFFPADIVQLRTESSSTVENEYFESGDIVFREGDVGDRMYVVISGEIEVLREGERLAMLAEGDYFGEMAVLSDEPRNATVRATKASTLASISKSDFGRLLGAFPRLEKQMGELIASRSKR